MGRGQQTATGLIALVTISLALCLLVGCGDDDSSEPLPREDNEAPTAVLVVPTTTLAGLAVLLDGSGSVDPDGVIEQYLFEIAREGEVADAVLVAASPELFTTFDEPGRYEIVLTVVDNDGTKASDSGRVVVR